jgi:hypothetical protein
MEDGEETQKVFDYKALANRVDPKTAMDNKNLIKCG